MLYTYTYILYISIRFFSHAYGFPPSKLPKKVVRCRCALDGLPLPLEPVRWRLAAAAACGGGGA